MIFDENVASRSTTERKKKKKKIKRRKESKKTKLSGGKKTSAITRLVSSRSSEIISADGNCRTIIQ